MNEQKSLIYQLAEAYERHRIERRTIAPEQNVQSQQPGRCHRFETHRRAGERGAVQRGTGQPDLRRHPDEHLERRSLPGDHGKWGDTGPARADPLRAHAGMALTVPDGAIGTAQVANGAVTDDNDLSRGFAQAGYQLFRRRRGGN